MPNPYYAEYNAKTTAELADILNTIALILVDRKIPSDYPEEQLRGGTRPTSLPLNP